MTNSDPLAKYKIFFVVMAVLCLGAIVLNYAVRRGPVQDAIAVDDLRSLSNSVQNYYMKNSELPADLSSLKSSLSTATRQRLSSYDYQLLGPDMYRLCATFNAASQDGGGISTMPYPVGGGEDPGIHGAGRQCFQYTVSGLPGSPKPL